MKKLLITAAVVSAAYASDADWTPTDSFWSPLSGFMPRISEFTLTPERPAAPVPPAVSPFKSVLEMRTFSRMEPIHTSSQCFHMGESVLHRTHTKDDTTQWEGVSSKHKAITAYEENKSLKLMLSPDLVIGTRNKIQLVLDAVHMGIDLLRTSCTAERPTDGSEKVGYFVVPSPTHAAKLGGRIFSPSHIQIHFPMLQFLKPHIIDELTTYGLSHVPVGRKGFFLQGEASRVRQYRHFVHIHTSSDWKDNSHLTRELSKALMEARNNFEISTAWTYYEMRIRHEDDDLAQAAYELGFKASFDPKTPNLPWRTYRKLRSEGISHPPAK